MSRILPRLTNSINLSWHIDDIRQEFEALQDNEYYLNVTLTDTDCRKILRDIKLNHDATCGVNWDVIRDYIESYISDTYNIEE